jgi:hypothetical protein
MTTTPMTPILPPSLSHLSVVSGSTVPLLHRKLSHDEDLDTRAMSMDDERVKQQPIKFSDLVQSPSTLPQQQSSRIERFMKRHLNKPEDTPGNKNIKIAKLKVEVGEAG